MAARLPRPLNSAVAQKHGVIIAFLSILWKIPWSPESTMEYSHHSIKLETFNPALIHNSKGISWHREIKALRNAGRSSHTRNGPIYHVWEKDGWRCERNNAIAVLFLSSALSLSTVASLSPSLSLARRNPTLSLRLWSAPPASSSRAPTTSPPVLSILYGRGGAPWWGESRGIPIRVVNHPNNTLTRVLLPGGW